MMILLRNINICKLYPFIIIVINITTAKKSFKSVVFFFSSSTKTNFKRSGWMKLIISNIDVRFPCLQCNDLCSPIPSRQVSGPMRSQESRMPASYWLAATLPFYGVTWPKLATTPSSKHSHTPLNCRISCRALSWNNKHNKIFLQSREQPQKLWKLTGKA